MSSSCSISDLSSIRRRHSRSSRIMIEGATISRNAPLPVAMAAVDRLPGYHVQCSSVPVLRPARLPSSRAPGWMGKTRSRQFQRSGLLPSTTSGICCSLTGGKDRGTDDRRRSKGGNRPELIEEDIYDINDGWKIDVGDSDEMVEVAGVKIPVKLKQQLQSEKRSRRVINRTPPEPPRTTHKLLRVMAGTCAGKKLTSPSDAQVRPMMEVVRGAVFNILQSFDNWTPSSSCRRWLDLYSGTGSVAIEGLSRGCCGEAHFVELDPWVISNVLRPNLEATNFLDQTVIHATKVENFFQQALQMGASRLGGPFDFVSVTPPYEAVSYAELMGQLSNSPLLSESSFVVVEYPLKSKREMPDTCGPLAKIKDRRYGRTHVAIYGPQWLGRDDPTK